MGKEESNYGFRRNTVAKMPQGRSKRGWEDYTQMDINGKEWEFCGLDSSGLGWVSAANSCKIVKGL